jgi:hypothetical protein
MGLLFLHMNRVTHPTRYQPRELLPASLLPYRQIWQPLIRALPTNTYLIVANLDNPPQNVSMLRLVHQLHRQGESVYVLSVGKRGCDKGVET